VCASTARTRRCDQHRRHPALCYADPYEGGKQAIAECYRNLSAVGALPLAVTNCLNFANPQRPEIMAQLVGCLDGMSEACRALDFPIVSGNVSLYNESKATGGGSAIFPPRRSAESASPRWRKSASIGFKAEGETIVFLGKTVGHLGQSLWLREIHGCEDGPPPPVDLREERLYGELVRALIDEGLVTAVHDVADGGAAVAVAEMVLAGNMGATIGTTRDDRSWTGVIFGEDQGRYMVTTSDPDAVMQRVMEAGRFGLPIGRTGGRALRFAFDAAPMTEISLDDLRGAHEEFFPRLMGRELAVA
jgi:phosphoribosylformylglycinamidine synthase